MEDLSREKKISAYLEEELSPEEAAAFEQEMAQDEDLAREVSFFSHLADAVQAEHDEDLLKKKLEAANARWHQRQQENTKVISLRRIATIAATVAILIIAGYFIYQNVIDKSPERLFAQYYEPLDVEALQALERYSGFGSENESMEDIVQAYTDGNFAAVKQQLEAYPEDKQRLQEIQLYLAIADMELGNYETAEARLENLVSGTKKPNLEDAIYWYYALVQVKLEDLETAKNTLQQIVNTDSAYQTQAATLLNEL